MQGCIDWNALPILAAVYGQDDIELLLFQLIAIREYQNTPVN